MRQIKFGPPRHEPRFPWGLIVIAVVLLALETGRAVAWVAAILLLLIWLYRRGWLRPSRMIHEAPVNSVDLGPDAEVYGNVAGEVPAGELNEPQTGGAQPSSMLQNGPPPKTYQSQVDDCLIALFGGFESGLVQRLKPLIDYKAFLKSYQGDQVPPKDCSIYATMLLIGELINRMSPSACDQAISAIAANDPRNSFSKGYYYMIQVAERLVSSEQLLNLLVYQVAGKLKGMSDEAIRNWWGESETAKIAQAYVSGGRPAPSDPTDRVQ